jgi:hypothetical protein
MVLRSRGIPGPPRERRAFSFAVWLLAAAGLAAAQGQGKSYMILVGDLVGAVEGPRVVQDVCVSRFPKRRAEFEGAYADWRTRHGDLLKAVDEQVVRANTRLRSQGAPPDASVVTTIDAILHRQFDSLDAANARKLCDTYPQILKTKDEEMTASVPALLEAVTNAERQTAAGDKK